MPTVSELMSENITNMTTNSQTWGGVMFNVKAYKAKGDGITDDTAAVQAAINAAIAANAKVVFFPAGTYKVTSLTSLSSVILLGDNATFSGITATIQQFGNNTTSVFINVKDKGAVGDGTTNDATSIQSVITAATTSGGIIFFPPGTYKISTVLTFASNMTVEFANGAKLSVDSGITVTINGPINAGMHQIFTGLGTIAGNIKVPFVVPQWWGATGDGVTDDTLAIRNAIASLSQGVLFFPPGNYLVSKIDTNNYCFKIDRPIKLIGTGMSSAIRLKAGTVTTCDIFYISPNMTYGGQYYGVEKLLIWGMDTVSGRNVFNFDVSVTGQIISNFLMADVYATQHGGYVINVLNAEGKQDGFFTATFERCLFYGGVYMQRVGDNIRFNDCVFRGNGRGIYVKTVSIPVSSVYPSQFIVDGCNFDCAAGALQVDAAKNISVIGCNIEQQSAALNGSIIDIRGTDTAVVNFTMERTHITAFGSAGASCNNIHLGTVTKATIDNCTLSNDVAGNIIVVDSVASDVKIGDNNYGNGTQLVNNGCTSLQYVFDKPSAQVKAVAGISVASGTATFIPFDTKVFDNATMYDAANNTKLTAKHAGKYLIIADVAIAASTTGERVVTIAINGSDFNKQTIPANSIAGSPTNINLSAFVNLNVNDYVQVWAAQYAGTALLVTGTLSAKLT